MLAAQRRELILDQVRRSGGVRVTDLVESLSVSDMTIRRDLDALESRGAIRKVHGGAVAPHVTSTEEPGFAVKSTREEREKDAIAREAARLVEPGSAVGLSAGTTTRAVAHHLRDTTGLTVVTNSLQAAEVFYRASRPDQTVALTGGFRTPSDALVGPIAVAALRNLHLDVLILGVHGMTERAGFTTPNLMEAETNAALVEAARTLIVVADHTKWQTVGISTIAPLSRCDVLVTDTGLDDEAHDALSGHVDRVILADPDRGNGDQHDQGERDEP
ncbi:DeoR/GlpR transcriptional regulator [Spiractinospora alimapuensis]|uniref:DeoR/GlpR family DNA-binding transcription regulator n=1 Tax=Spiractinospora alimapuensis TaxID=2820884 RepID=UPI001F3C8744|nr:DeoR/GlpR family DNA-binding transcription regulator [Spiractinospora alimapuensis]QVQ49980.1 DeoR/GlpR transcriptional regulator [Spiractinospora alimapuensis]